MEEGQRIPFWHFLFLWFTIEHKHKMNRKKCEHDTKLILQVILDIFENKLGQISETAWNVSKMCDPCTEPDYVNKGQGSSKPFVFYICAILTCRPSSICACWKVMMFCEWEVCPSVPSELADVDTDMVDPVDGPPANKRLLALPGEGELNRSAAEGPTGDWRRSAQRKIKCTTAIPNSRCTTLHQKSNLTSENMQKCTVIIRF